MTAKKIQALILSKRPFGDGHIVLSVLSKEMGFLKIFAFGGQRLSKRFKGRLDYFRIMEFEIQTTVKEGLPCYNLSSVNEIKKTFDNISKEVKKYFIASYVLELPSLVLTENEDYFNIVCDYLEKIDKMQDISNLTELLIEYTLCIYQRTGFICDTLNIANNKLAMNELENLHYRLINKIPKSHALLKDL